MNKKRISIAIVGATGLVGQELVSVLAERGYNLDQVMLSASERSVGRTLMLEGKAFEVREIKAILDKKPDIAFFSAGGSVAKEWAPRFWESGITVIDNSSAFRMEPEIPLIIPEVNGDQLSSKSQLIANPNCSTIQLALVLFPIHKHFGLERVNVSTYQSVTGSGQQAVDQLKQEREGQTPEAKAYPWAIDLNCLPHCDDFQDNGYTKEEEKVMNESRKILKKEDLPITATAVRVPVMGGHAESVNLSLTLESSTADMRSLLSDMPGVTLQDNPDKNHYPMPGYARKHDDVFVGRIRQDQTQQNGWHLWVVSDNLRKGAATNAVQILDYLALKIWK